MAIINSIMSEAGDAVPPWVQVLLEVLLFALIIGSLLYAARRMYIDVRASRIVREALDEAALITAVDASIDEPLRDRLRDGTIRLLRCSWVLATEGVVSHLPRMQDVPAEAFFEPEEAADLFARGDRSVLVLSHGAF